MSDSANEEVKNGRSKDELDPNAEEKLDCLEDKADPNPSPNANDENHANDENDTEEAGYRSDRSASDDGSTDAFVDRKRDKGSSGYEESGEEEEEGVSEISEGRRERTEQEEDEYDKEATADASSGDDISEGIEEEGSEGYEEDTEEEEESKGYRDPDDESKDLDDDEVEDVTSPSFVPKRTGFWGHDDRYDNIRVEESRTGRGGKKRTLWDKTSDRWEHDMYKEEEQGPKESWEIEESQKEAERRPQRGRNRQKLGDFVGSRGRNGRGRSARQRRENEVNNDRQEDSSEFEEKLHDGQQRGRGRPGNQRGRPRGRGGSNKEGRRDWKKENEAEQERRNNTKKVGEYNWQQDLDARNEGAQRRGQKASEDMGDWADASTTKRETEGRKSEGKKSQVRKETTEESHQRTKRGEKEVSHGPKSTGKDVITDRVISSKRTETEFVKERKKKSEVDYEENEDTFEDVVTKDGAVVETTDAKKGPSSAKPKRYSSQRQRSNATDEQQFHNQEADSTSIQDGQFYNQLPQQDAQSGMLDQNAMAFMQYQMQQMQLQMQAMQAHRYESAMSSHQQQQQPQQQQSTQQQQQQQQKQVPMQQSQAPQVMTPAMQQYMQQQFFMQLQALQNTQLQQQQQQHQGQQQQQQIQQQQLQEMRARQQMPEDSGQQKGSPDPGMVLQTTTYQAMPTNIRSYGVATQPPGIYTQAGTQFDVPFEQVMSARPPPQQQAGLFIPTMHQFSQQQMQMQDAQRKIRSAAIPIKPPPDQQES